MTPCCLDDASEGQSGTGGDRFKARRRAVRPSKWVRTAAIAALALVFVALLPMAPAQTGRDLGVVRSGSGGDAASAPGAIARPGPAATLTYRPFLDPAPMPVHSRWYLLLLPMSFGVAVVYKAATIPSMERYWRSVLYLTVEIVVGMILLAIASYAVVMWYVPWMSER